MYRTALGVVHMRGSKLPDPCAARIWLAGKDVVCAAFSGFLCDHPDDSGHTCDKALCDAHAKLVGRNRHYCPDHFKNQMESSPQGGLFTGLLE